MVLTYEQLDSSLTRILPRVQPYSFEIFDYFRNLYSIGCRPNELNDITRWQILNNETAQLQPLKHNNPREIERVHMTFRLWRAVETQSGSPYGFLYSKQLYFFRKWYEFGTCQIGAKNVDLYLFRHRYVKALARDGMTLAQITDKMGWVNSTIAEGYINSVITTS